MRMYKELFMDRVDP